MQHAPDRVSAKYDDTHDIAYSTRRGAYLFLCELNLVRDWRGASIATYPPVGRTGYYRASHVNEEEFRWRTHPAS